MSRAGRSGRAISRTRIWRRSGSTDEVTRCARRGGSREPAILSARGYGREIGRASAAFGELGAGDYVAIAIIDMILAMALVSFAVNGGVIGTLVVLGLIAGFNVLALSGRLKGRAPHERRARASCRAGCRRRPGPQHEGGRGKRDAARPAIQRSGKGRCADRVAAAGATPRPPSVMPAPAPSRDAAPAVRGSASAAARPERRARPRSTTSRRNCP